MTDFLHPLIMWAIGGMYLDADMIPCHGLDFMIDNLELSPSLVFMGMTGRSMVLPCQLLQGTG